MDIIANLELLYKRSKLFYNRNIHISNKTITIWIFWPSFALLNVSKTGGISIFYYYRCGFGYLISKSGPNLCEIGYSGERRSISKMHTGFSLLEAMYTVFIVLKQEYPQTGILGFS